MDRFFAIGLASMLSWRFALWFFLGMDNLVSMRLC